MIGVKEFPLNVCRNVHLCVSIWNAIEAVAVEERESIGSENTSSRMIQTDSDSNRFGAAQDLAETNARKDNVTKRMKSTSGLCFAVSLLFHFSFTHFHSFCLAHTHKCTSSE
jgi:hypothetical protein